MNRQHLAALGSHLVKCCHFLFSYRERKKTPFSIHIQDECYQVLPPLVSRLSIIKERVAALHDFHRTNK